MRRLEYFYYKNRKWFILAAVVLIGVLILVMVIAGAIKHNSVDNTNNGNSATITEAAIVTPSNEWVGTPEDSESTNEIEQETVNQKVLIHVEDGIGIYEAVLELQSGRFTVYENGVDSGKNCKMLDYKINKEYIKIPNTGIISADEKKRLESWLTGDKSRVIVADNGRDENDSYDEASNLLKGILNILSKNEMNVVRKVLSQEYVDIYLKNKEGNIFRLAEYKDKVYLSEYSEQSLPEIISYFE